MSAQPCAKAHVAYILPVQQEITKPSPPRRLAAEMFLFVFRKPLTDGVTLPVIYLARRVCHRPDAQPAPDNVVEFPPDKFPCNSQMDFSKAQPLPE